MKRFNVAIPNEDGTLTLAPMKEWLRQNPKYIPEGLDATSSTSHALRNALGRNGWTIRESETECQLIKKENKWDVNAILGNEDDISSDNPEISPPYFELEKNLRDFIAHNIQRIPIEGKQLSLYVDPTGRDGIEYPTSTGPIDILAVNGDGDFFVFELKRASSPDSAVGQLARYVGWIKKTIGINKNVYGIIVAKKIDNRLKYAISVIPNFSLFEYKIEFQLQPKEIDSIDIQKP